MSLENAIGVRTVEAPYATLGDGTNQPWIVRFVINALDDSGAGAALSSQSGVCYTVVPGGAPLVIGNLTDDTKVKRVDLVGVADTASTGNGVIIANDSSADAQTAMTTLTFNDGDDVLAVEVQASRVNEGNACLVTVKGWTNA